VLSPTSLGNVASSTTSKMMSFRSTHEGAGFGHAAAAASGAPLPWWAGPTAAPMLCGEPLGLGRTVPALSPEDHCRDGRFQVLQGPLAPVAQQQPERGLPELLNLSVAHQGEDMLLCLCVLVQ
jgi:nuclear transcription factor Y alpha